jgi:hypothetical protein
VAFVRFMCEVPILSANVQVLHAFDLIVKDILQYPLVHKVLKRIKRMVRFVRNSHRVHPEVQKLNASIKKPEVAAITRISSSYNMLSLAVPYAEELRYASAIQILHLNLQA